MSAAALQGTALASSPDAASRLAAVIQANGIRAGAAPAVTSDFLAGYAAGFSTNNQNTVSTLTVNKTGTCNAATKAVVASAYSFNTLFSGAFAFSGCIDGQPFAFVSISSSDGTELAPDEVTAPGDKIKVQITDTTANVVTVTNLTQGWSASVQGPVVNPVEYQVGNGTAVLVDDPDNPLPLPKFGSTAFTGTKIGKLTLKASEPTEVDLVNADGALLADALAITNNTNFNVRFVKAS